MRTHDGFKWELGKEVITNGKINNLCNDSWLHYYHHPLLAILLNPIHAEIDNPRLFEVKALGKHLNDKGLKGGCTKMTLIKELKLPEITLNQKIAFAILCSLEVYRESTYVSWANNWLGNKNRTYADAANAADAAAARTYGAYYSADVIAARAADDAANAANTANTAVIANAAANDAAADADTTLASGGLYTITGARTIFRKP